MNRLQALTAIQDESGGILSVTDPADGWPALAELRVGSQTVEVALYLGVFGASHRGRDSAEQRFQNPGQDRPIEFSRARFPLLMGMALRDAGRPPVLVGFEPARRIGRRTRFSMFAPMDLIESGFADGWAERENSASERLVAFLPHDLARYFTFRFGNQSTDNRRGPPMSSKNDLLGDVASVMGLYPVPGLGARLSEALACAPPNTEEEAYELLRALAEREAVSDGGHLTWESALRAVAPIDDRIDVMLAVWDEVGASGPMPRSHEVLVAAIYEDARFYGRQAADNLPTTISKIARKCEPDLDEDDLEVFFDGAAPTLFFYESVRSYLEASDEMRGERSDEGDQGWDGDEDDDDQEEQTQPVKAHVDKLQVVQLFNLVSKNRLDIEPPWQRKDVWSLKKKRELIKSLILGIPLPSIILHNREGRMSIIDGKQRLTAIMQFLRNEWKLPKYKVSPGGPLYECRGSFYAKEGKKSLPQEIRDSLELRNIPALIFEDVPEARLRRIFELYNVAGMKLNAAEIRNAVYQSNRVHQVIYVLAGEGDGRTDLGIGGSPVQRAFAERLRHVYPGSKKRYQGVDFLARYLGYSRAVTRPGSDHFRIPSTSAAINNYFEHRSADEDPADVAKELVEVMDRAEDLFDLDEERLAFFVRNDSGQRQFNKLVATTHMVAARFLNALIKGSHVDEGAARNAAAAVYCAPPEKQQRATIWDYQARVLLGLRGELDVDVAATLGQEWTEFFEKMEYCLLPEGEEG